MLYSNFDQLVQIEALREKSIFVLSLPSSKPCHSSMLSSKYKLKLKKTPKERTKLMTTSISPFNLFEIVGHCDVTL